MTWHVEFVKLGWIIPKMPDNSPSKYSSNPLASAINTIIKTTPSNSPMEVWFALQENFWIIRLSRPQSESPSLQRNSSPVFNWKFCLNPNFSRRHTSNPYNRKSQNQAVLSWSNLILNPFYNDFYKLIANENKSKCSFRFSEGLCLKWRNQNDELS